jgi:hypothetical protein
MNISITELTVEMWLKTVYCQNLHSNKFQPNGYNSYITLIMQKMELYQSLCNLIPFVHSCT